jgi:hypothetical protein
MPCSRYLSRAACGVTEVWVEKQLNRVAATCFAPSFLTSALGRVVSGWSTRFSFRPVPTAWDRSDVVLVARCTSCSPRPCRAQVGCIQLGAGVSGDAVKDCRMKRSLGSDVGHGARVNPKPKPKQMPSSYDPLFFAKTRAGPPRARQRRFNRWYTVSPFICPSIHPPPILHHSQHRAAHRTRTTEQLDIRPIPARLEVSTLSRKHTCGFGRGR